MASSVGLGFSCLPHLPLLPPLLHSTPKVRLSSVAAFGTIDEQESPVKGNSDRHIVNSGVKGKVAQLDFKAHRWKRLSSEDLGISNSSIPKTSRVVLDQLKKEGFQVYLVGGCVRDLILKRTPKDFDIVTSAELKEVRSIFSECHILGKRFPICHVHIEDTIVEVSSFSTCADSDLGLAYKSPVGCDENDYMRWRNCLHRDFTINGFMFDPYANLVYDYMGGLEDIKRAKVRTMIRPSISFRQDCARILRAVRIAARLGFLFADKTGRQMVSLASSVSGLDKLRLLMETNYMLAYGSAEASLRLLWRFRILETLLPIQAAYFIQEGFTRCDRRSNMLLSLFSTMDNLLALDRRCHCSLWVGILAFHKALYDQPRDPYVVAAFCLTVHNGGDISEALNIARSIATPHNTSFNELLQPQNLEVEAWRDEVMDLAASVKTSLTNMTDEHFVLKTISAVHRTPPYSDLVFIPLDVYLRVCKMFECVRQGKEKGFVAKQGTNIDYKALAVGSLQEVRHVFARVVFDTVFPVPLNQHHRPS